MHSNPDVSQPVSTIMMAIVASIAIRKMNISYAISSDKIMRKFTFFLIIAISPIAIPLVVALSVIAFKSLI